MAKKNNSLVKRKLSHQRSVSKIVQQTTKNAEGKTVVSLEKKSFFHQHIWEILAFFIPMLLVLIGFALEKLYPFGDRQFLVTDLWHQYYPFFQTLHEKLQEGGSLFYTWRSGLGTNFLALMAYYCASPLNLLSVFVPQEFLREAFAAILLLKFAFAGLFFAKMLRYVFNKNDISITMFAVMYALCSYMMGYYWNVIWIDTVALLPLVMLGLVALVREGKYRTYVIALALALFTNYYIALFICIFTVFAFFILCIFQGFDLRTFGKRFAQIAGCSLCGAGLSAWLLIPTYQALQLTNSANNSFPDKIKFYESWLDIISNMLAFNDPTSKSGLPNLYCGLLPVLLLGVFLFAKEIRLREKLAAVFMLVFLILSCNINFLNFIWHGFHFTNMLPYRFSFLFSFVLLVAAYRAYQVLLKEKFDISYWIMLLITGIIFCTAAYYARPEESKQYIWASAILGAVYIAVFLLREFASKRVVEYIIAAVLMFEMATNAINGVDTVGTSDRKSYPSKGSDIAVLVDQAQNSANEYFYRTELTTWYTLNDPCLYYYDGVSQFSSMANKSVTTFMRMMSIPAGEGGNRYFYVNTSPVTNMMLGIRYILSKDGYNADANMTEIGQSGAVKMYENEYYLPIGYMMESAVKDYVFDESMNAFEIQNALFRQMTGIEGDLFTPIDITNVGHKGLNVTRNDYGSYQYTVAEDAEEGNTYLKYNFTTPHEGMFYAFTHIKQTTAANSTSNADYLDVYQADTKLHSYNTSRQPYITPVGYFTAGEKITLRANIEEDIVRGSAKVYFYELNKDVLDQGYAALADETLQVTSFADASFTGDITVNEDGYLYLSMPYEKGWSAKVDGKSVEVERLFGAICGIPLTAGTHSIKLSYIPNGFIPGAVISIGCAGILIVLWVLERKKKAKNAPKDPETTSEPENSEKSEEQLALEEIISDDLKVTEKRRRKSSK